MEELPHCEETHLSYVGAISGSVTKAVKDDSGRAPPSVNE
jgi:hypothetical protein